MQDRRWGTFESFGEQCFQKAAFTEPKTGGSGTPAFVQLSQRARERVRDRPLQGGTRKA